MTGTFYKAVRPDGTDFYTGTVRWLPPVGESLPDDGLIVTHPTVRKKSPGGACDYLSVATVATDCTGMEWPCRLARVERTRAAVWTPDGELLPHKRASWQWRVVEELDPTLALGPQGAEVAAIIDRARRLTDGEAEALDAARVAIRYADLVAAWDAAYGATYDDRDAVYVATRNAARVSRGTAQEATKDAVLAVLARDLISESDYQLLAGPWLSVIGDADTPEASHVLTTN